MNDYLKEFFKEFDYPEEAEQAISDAYQAVSSYPDASDAFHSRLNQYQTEDNLDYDDLFIALDQAAGETGIHKYTLHLLFFICLSRYTKERYKQHQIDIQIFHDSMLDLKWKLLECHDIYGIWGSFVASWFPGFFDLTRFAFGRLQFEKKSYTETYQSGDVQVLPGDTVINMHIPSCGPLHTEDCMASFQKAAAFYHDSFPDKPTVFVCYSWLLYPKHREFLPAHSNILKFMDFFHILTCNEQKEGSDLWRIFHQADCTDIDNLPKDTSLQRAYADWLKNGGVPGWGHGIFLLDGNKII